MSKKRNKKKGAKRHLKSVKSKTKKPARKSAGKSPGKAPASTAVREYCLEVLRFARKELNKYASTIPDEQATAQPPGLPNHALWTYGHLATTSAWVLSLLTGEKGAVPESYEKMFGMGSTPSADASQYPPLAEVKGYYEQTHQKTLDAASKMNDADLAKPIEAGGFAKDKADLLVKIAWHEGWHLGQVCDTRRGLGLPRQNPM
jgi:uncharacterized damage-inducible protein DinB